MSTAQKGEELILAIEDPQNPGTFLKVGGFQRNDFNLRANGFRDVSHSGTAGFQTLMGGTGETSLGLTGTGVFLSDAVMDLVMDQVMDRTTAVWEVTVPGLARFTGPFVTKDVRLNAPNEDVVTFSITLDSAGILSREALNVAA